MSPPDSKSPTTCRLSGFLVNNRCSFHTFPSQLFAHKMQSILGCHFIPPGNNKPQATTTFVSYLDLSGHFCFLFLPWRKGRRRSGARPRGLDFSFIEKVKNNFAGFRPCRRLTFCQKQATKGNRKRPASKCPCSSGNTYK